MSNYLSHSLTNLVEFFTYRTHKQSALPNDFDVNQMTEHAVDAIDPKIRVISRYSNKLSDPITHTWEYLSQVADRIPYSLSLSKASYVADPRTRIIFPSWEEVQELLHTIKPLLDSRDVNQYVQGTHHDEGNHIYMLLCMEKKEHNFFGAELSGDIIKREVQQTSVSFTNHKLLSAGFNEEKSKLGFKKCAFDGLLHKVHSLIMLSNDDYKKLIERKTQLHHQLLPHEKDFHQHSYGAGSFQGHLFDTHPELQEIERKLQEIRNKSASPDYHLEQAVAVLTQPDHYLKVETHQITVNKFGVKQSNANKSNAVVIDYADVEIEKELKRTAVIASCPAQDIFPHQSH